MIKTKEYFEELSNPDYEDPFTKFLKACPVVDGIVQIPSGAEEELKEGTSRSPRQAETILK